MDQLHRPAQSNLNCLTLKKNEDCPLAGGHKVIWSIPDSRCVLALVKILKMQMAHSVRQRSHWPLSRSERLDDWECKSSKWPVRLGNTGHSPATMAEDLTLKKSLELSSKRLGFQFSSAVCKSNNIFFIIYLFFCFPPKILLIRLSPCQVEFTEGSSCQSSLA